MLAAAPYSPPEVAVERELLGYMQASGWVMEVAEGIVFHHQAWHEIVTWVLTTIDTHGSVSVAQLRDRGWEIGFHTRRHDALPGLDEGAQRHDNSLAASSSMRESVFRIAPIRTAAWFGRMCPRAVCCVHGCRLRLPGPRFCSKS
jgi:hypothetical protein